MRVLLTGATGFLGFRTLERLILDETITSIVACGRTLKPTHVVEHAKVTYKLGDLSDPTYVNEIMQGINIVIHAAALSSPWGKKQEFEKANVIPQKNLIKAARSAKIRRFIFISTPSIYFDYRHRFNITEEDSIAISFVNDYAQTKYEAEKLLESAGIPYIILRPRALTGRGDTVIMPRLIKAHQDGRLKIIGDGTNLADLTAVANVAEVIRTCVHVKEHALNTAYNITNGEPVQLWKTISNVLEQLELEPPQKKVPYRLVRIIAFLMELQAKFTTKEPVLTQYSVGTLAKSMTFDISKAKKFLNYVPAVSTSEAVAEFVDWYKEHEGSTVISQFRRLLSCQGKNCHQRWG